MPAKKINKTKKKETNGKGKPVTIKAVFDSTKSDYRGAHGVGCRN